MREKELKPTSNCHTGTDVLKFIKPNESKRQAHACHLELKIPCMGWKLQDCRPCMVVLIGPMEVRFPVPALCPTANVAQEVPCSMD